VPQNDSAFLVMVDAVALKVTTSYSGAAKGVRKTEMTTDDGINDTTDE